MRYESKEIVAGTSVTIGRRVQRRTINGKAVDRVSSTYYAEYKDGVGQRRYATLRTTNRREARKLAVEIQKRLESGDFAKPAAPITVAELNGRYMEFCEHKDLAPTTLVRYRSDLAKLSTYCDETEIIRADRFDEREYYRYGSWLRNQVHKQRAKYAPKSLYTALTICKQMFKWGHRNKLLMMNHLESVRLPPNRAGEQKCFTTEQVEKLLELAEGRTHDAIAILAFTGLRVGELEQLRWSDVRLDLGETGKLHIRRGGSRETTKDKDARLIPIHVRISPIFNALPRTDELVMPGLRQRQVLADIKRLSRKAGFVGNYKTHSLRHHFASMCANSAIPYRMALEWMGHSSSSILDLYYHLHDAESEAAMQLLAQRTHPQRE